ncbi:hypothetical protein [Deinococcus sp. UR1]|uniref:hypothetical protein n=1 Tax=Deinococcus sp. UR1 TaxID=1704277 RepID=UPI000C1911DC|nr:hypothetical protein [Deinococcus sp. UR1]PIG96910.1 hypothetical protein AMD26_015405 [Deinococcus sp. UR1]
MPANLPTTSTYRDVTITDHTLVARLTCPYVISLPGFGPLGARTLEEAHAKIDNFIAHQTQPAPAGQIKILAVLPTGAGARSMSASTMRGRAERARGQNRKGGKFA